MLDIRDKTEEETSWSFTFFLRNLAAESINKIGDENGIALMPRWKKKKRMEEMLKVAYGLTTKENKVANQIRTQ